ncbi:MAG: hypothetical protein J0J04_07970 [Microbacterium sp.]|uniref:hypothetical protein n=1 Tax=Microbacterium sp. TaxID=51671 RepID=UPI001ACFD5E3|nr:hypothetical protein [Microbacterium sp.]MBN9214736.1 hypothetical protein [Microbacterium sp.]
MDKTVMLFAIGAGLMLVGVAVVCVAATRYATWARPVGVAGFAVVVAGVFVLAFGASSVSVE